MKRLSLRAELRLWSAALVAAILLVAGGGVTVYLRHQEITELDHELQLVARHFLRVYRGNGADPAWITAAHVESTISECRENGWFVEIADGTGRTLYRSAGLAGDPLAGAPPGIADFDIGDSGVRLAVVRDAGVSVRVAADLDDLNEISSSMLIALGVVFPGVCAIIFFGSRWLAARALAPVAELAAAAERVTARNLSERLPVPATGDEPARLATVLNATFDRLATAFAQATRFSADASHELKTPLAIARAALESMLGESSALAPADRENAEAALSQLDRVTRITRTLLLLSRADAGQLGANPVPGDLVPLLRDCAEDARVAATERGISLSLEIPAAAPAVFDPGGATLALQNLFENAVKYNRDGGFIQARLDRRGDAWEIRISNDGPGISEADASRIFERFHRGSAPVGLPGHGLGLSLARELARAQGGEVTFCGSAGGSTTFSFALPFG